MAKDNFGVEIKEGSKVFYINSMWAGRQVMAKGTVHHVKGDRVYLDVPEGHLPANKYKQWVVASKVAVIQ